jgi:LysM repeat protein
VAPFPDLPTLASFLRGEASATGQIELSAATVWPDSPSVPALVKANLYRDDLILAANPDDIKVTNGKLAFSVVTPSSQADTLLGLLGAQGTIALTLVGTENVVNLVLTIQPATGKNPWTFGTSWPPLLASSAEIVPWSDPQLVFSTTAAQPLTFSASVSLTGATNPLAPVLELLPAADQQLSVGGAIKPGPSAQVTAPLLSSGLTLGKLIEIGAPYFGVKTFLQQYDPNYPKAGTYVEAQWLVGAPVGLGTHLDAVDLEIVYQPATRMFAFRIEPSEPYGGVDLADLATALLGGMSTDGFTGAFSGVAFAEQVLDEILKYFAFKGFVATFALSPPTVTSLQLAVGSPLEQDGKTPVYPLPIIPGVLTAEDFEVQWTMVNPGGPSQVWTVAIAADLLFAGKFPFELDVTLPTFTLAGKYTGKPVSLSMKEVEDELFSGHHLEIPLEIDVEFTGLSFSASPPTAYSVTLDAGADIELFGTRILAVSEGVFTVTLTYPEREGALSQSDGAHSFAFHGTISIGQLDFDVDAQVPAKGTGDTVFTIHMVGQTLGSLLSYLVSLVDPYLELNMESPWDKLNAIDLDALVLTVNITAGTVDLSYPIDLDLGFMTLKSIDLKYERADTVKNVPSSLAVDLSGSFLGLEYGSGPGKPPLGWNPVTDRAPAVPGQGSSIFDLRYLGLGQHVTPSGADLTTIDAIFKSMEGTMVPLSPGASDPTAIPGIQFSTTAQWLIAADFSVMGAVSIKGVFNDPVLAGIRIELSGEKVKSFAGLAFEILYTRVTPTIGLYHIELALPTAMRHLEFGEVSVTLPIVDLDVYTNGNFRIDFGFPQGLDFSRSFSVQVFPFVGYGGFYFALLDGQTSKRVPQITNGQWHPVIEFGLGLSLGVGKTIDEGIFSAGASVTLIGIVQGVVAWFEPTDTSTSSDVYYWIQGTVALAGQIFGKVDFAIISVDVQISAYASVTFTIECYEPIFVALVAEVEVEASIKILFIRIHFSFSLTLNLAFTIGSTSTPPWQVAQGDSGSNPKTLAAQSAQRPARAVHARAGASRMQQLGLTAPPGRVRFDWTPRSVGHLLVGSAPVRQELDITVVPAFTLADGAAGVQCVLLPFVGNSISPQARTAVEAQQVADAAADAPFNQFAVRLFAWTVGALDASVTGPDSVISWCDLQHVSRQIYDSAIEDAAFSYANLRAFLKENFVVRLAGRTPMDGATANELSGTLFPVLADLTMTADATTVDFAAFTPVTTSYQQTIDAYLAQLEVAYENAVQSSAATSGDPPCGEADSAPVAPLTSGDPSMAMLVLGNYCTMVARAVVGAAIGLMRAFPFEIASGEQPSIAEIAGSFTPAEAIYITSRGDTLAGIATTYATTPNTLRDLNPPLKGDSDDQGLDAGIRMTVPIVVTPESVVAANASQTGILAAVELPLGGIQYQALAGDTFKSIATRIAGGDGRVTCPAGELATATMAANVDRAVLQAGAQLAVSLPLAYTVQEGDTLDLVAATYVVRAGGSGVLNVIPGLPQLVTQLAALNKRPDGSKYGPNDPIPDGTQIVLPSPQSPRTARMNDTLTRIAGMLLAAAAPAVDLMAMIGGLRAANRDLPADLTQPLTDGQTLTAPPVTVSVQPGETFASIAGDLGAAAKDLGELFLAQAGVIAPGAVLAIPAIDFTPGTGDSLGGVAGRFNLTLDDLTSCVEGVAGIFQAPVSITVPHVPTLTLGELQRAVLESGSLNSAAASVSRFLLHGLRLPEPSSAGILAASQLAQSVDTAPLYELTGQQFVLPATLPPNAGLVLKSSASDGLIELYMASYTVRQGDTLAGIAATFAPSDQSALEAALAQLNPGAPLNAGDVLVFPGAATYVTSAGDTLASITSRFGSSPLFPSELQVLNPKVDFAQLSPGTELALPIADSYTTVKGDTLAGIAKAFVTTDQLAAFETAVKALNIAIDFDDPLPAGTVLVLPEVTPRIPVTQLGLTYSPTELTTVAALETAQFRSEIQQLERLPLYRELPQRYPLQHSLHWQCAAPPWQASPSQIKRLSNCASASGEPTLWPFPTSLTARLTATGDPEPIYQLMSAQAGSPAEAAAVGEVGCYTWATSVDVQIRQIPGPDGPLPNCYVVVGADQAGADQLRLLWEYIETKGGGVATFTPSAELLYPPNPTGANPHGYVSDALDSASTCLVQADLSTVTQSSAMTADAAARHVGDAPLVHSAGIGDVQTLVELLWACSVVHSGGYYLHYATATGGDLPGYLFDQGPEATLTLLVIVDEGSEPPMPPPARPVHNCALVASNIDAGATDVFVQPLVHIVAAADTLASVSAELAADYGLTTTPQALAVANASTKGLLRPGATLASTPSQTYPVVYGDTFAKVALKTGTDVGTLGRLNAAAAAFQAGALLQLSDGELTVTANAPAGNTGFRLTRTNAETLPPGTQAEVEALLQLLAYSIAPTTGWRESPEGLPAGPTVSSGTDGLASKDVRDPSNPTWDYAKLLPVHLYADDLLGADAPQDITWVLPSPWADPYRGIAAQQPVTIDLSFRDVYGNAAAGSTTSCPVPIGYFDELAGVDRWPSVAAHYAFGPGAPPICELSLTFDPTPYVAGPGLSNDAAVRNAAARACRYGEIWYQLRQPDVGAVMRSSLDQPSGTPAPAPTAYPMTKAALLALVGSAYAFLLTAQELVAYEHTARTADTLVAVASQYVVSVAELAKANADADVSKLFAVPQGKQVAVLSIPAFYVYRFGDTLASTELSLAQIQAGSLAVPLNEGVDLSLASQPGTYPLQKGDTLRGIAYAQKAMVSAVAIANQEHRLTNGKTLIAGGKTLAAGDSDTLKSMVTRFATEKVTTTVQDLALGNQDAQDLFDATAAPDLSIADRVVQAGETLGSLTTGKAPLSLLHLYEDNQATQNVFSPGAALWEINSEYDLQEGDTLASVAARYGIDVLTLVTIQANATAPLREGAELIVPSQVVIGGSGPGGSVYRLSAPETLGALATKYATTTPGLIALNRYTQGLFVASGSLTVNTVTVPVVASDSFDSLATKARYAPAEFPQFASAAAQAIAGGAAILVDGAIFVCPPMKVGPSSSGGSATTLSDTAAAYGVGVLSLVRANGSLRGLLREHASVTYEGELVQIGSDDTLVTLAARFTEAGIPLTLEDLATHVEFTGADMLALGAPLVPPPADAEESIPFTATPRNPAAIFGVTVDVELSRTLALVDPDFYDVSQVQVATTRIAPRTQDVSSDDPAKTLQAFAGDFENAFPGLKAAISRSADGGRGQVWAVDFRGGQIEFQIDNGQQRPHQGYVSSAAYFALPPLSTGLLSYPEVPIQAHESGQQLQPAAPRAFSAVDLDAWMSQMLTAVDDFLSPAYATAARQVDAVHLDQVIADKGKIAQLMSAKVEPVFTYGEQGDSSLAAEELRQQMLTSLGSAYSVDTIVQLPVTISSPFDDAATAPRLAGQPVDVAGGSGTPGYTLSPAKVALADGGSYLTFVVSVKHPASDRRLNLDLRYAIGEIEYDIASVAGISGYQSSSWLSLLIPIGDPGADTPTDRALAQDALIGELCVPVPLRVTPTPPSMVAQAATPVPATDKPSSLAAILDRLKRWDYGFTFEHQSSDQDTRHVSVTFNGPPPGPAVKGGVEDPKALFYALAQFVSVYPAVQHDLAVLPTLGPGTSSPSAVNAVAIFADLIARVTAALQPALEEAAEDQPSIGITVDYSVEVTESQPGTWAMVLTLLSAPAPGVGWPELFAVDSMGIKHQLIAAAPSGDTRSYTYPSGVETTTARYAWAFEDLDVTAIQSGVAAMWVVRNQNLGGSGQTVNQEFVYTTAVAEFSNPVVPLLVRQDVVPIRDSGGSVTASLEAVLDCLFGSGTWSADIGFAGRYSYQLGQGGGDGSALRAELPIFVVTDYPLTNEVAETFSGDIDTHVTGWRGRERPNPAGGGYLLELTVFASKIPGTGQPVLDLRNLLYSLS